MVMSRSPDAVGVEVGEGDAAGKKTGGVSRVSHLTGPRDVVLGERQNKDPCEITVKYLKAKNTGGVGSIHSILPGTGEEGVRVI